MTRQRQSEARRETKGSHARGHLEHEAQRAERGRCKSDLAPGGLQSVLGSGCLFCRCRHVQDINIFVSDVPRDIDVCQWNRARRLSRYIQLITRIGNGVL